MNEKPKHNHGEAFALMWYACKCGHRERMWNSRDGVTPFGLSCPSCGQPSLLHAEWSKDEYTPNHKLNLRQRFWRDGTPDEAEDAIRKRIKRWGEKYPCTPEMQAKMIANARNPKGTEGEFQKGWPMLDENSL